MTKFNLKFSGQFKTGDVIKAHDFKPMDGRADSFILGRVIETENFEHGFAAYKVETLKHVIIGKEETEERGDVAFIPHEVSFSEYDERIQLVA